MELMKDIGKAMKSLGAMARGKVPLDSAKVKAAADSIAQHGQKIPALFPKGSTKGVTEAGPRIWKDPEGFQKSTNEMVDAARNITGTIRECRSSKTCLSQARQDLQRLPQAIPGQEKEDGTPAIAAAIRLTGTGRSALGPRESGIDATATRPFIIFTGDLGLSGPAILIHRCGSRHPASLRAVRRVLLPVPGLWLYSWNDCLSGTINESLPPQEQTRPSLARYFLPKTVLYFAGVTLPAWRVADYAAAKQPPISEEDYENCRIRTG